MDEILERQLSKEQAFATFSARDKALADRKKSCEARVQGCQTKISIKSQTGLK